MERKRVWIWICMIFVFLIAVILVTLFGDAIVLRIAPKAVLTSKISEFFSQLENRFQDDPLVFLARAIDPEGKYTIEADFETSNTILGPVNYEMTIQTNGELRKVSVEGNAESTDKSMDFSVYADSEFIAVSSADLGNGAYYGITYDSFADDIRSIPLLQFFIGDTIFTEWEQSVKALKAQIRQSYFLPEIPVFSNDDLQKLLLGMLALPCKVEKTAIAVENGFAEGYALTYQISEKQLNSVLSNTTWANIERVAVVFYLYNNHLNKITVSCQSDESSYLYGLHLGANPAEDEICLEIMKNNESVCDSYVITVDTQCVEDTFSETWTIGHVIDGKEKKEVFRYDWENSSGSLCLTRNTLPSVTLTLQEKENGFWLKTNDFAALIQLLTNQSVENKMLGACTMNIQKSSEITTPEYINLDQWSIEDFLTLLSGVGSLLGINIGM